MVDTIDRPSTAHRPNSRYDIDFFAWTQAQAAVLRAAARSGVNLPIDWENLAEEVESLGRADIVALKSRLRTIMEHLLKLEFSPAIDPRPSWRETVTRARIEFEELIDESPSLKQRVEDWIDQQQPRAARLVLRNMADHSELSNPVETCIRERRYSAAETLGDWFPPA